MSKFLILGAGFLGRRINSFFKDSFLSETRINSVEGAINIIKDNNPEIVINCIGKTGRPNVDWCENNKLETTFANVTVPEYIAIACKKLGKYMVHIGSGCIYSGNNGGLGFSEDDPPNFAGSHYSITKAESEKTLSSYKILQVRIRMPIDNFNSERNLLDKLLKYDKILDAENSITVIPDFLNTLDKLMSMRLSGIFNLVNKGVVKNSEILKMYAKISGKEPKFEVISELDLDRITLAKRSNCVLSMSKLESLGLEMPDVKSSLEKCITEYASHKKG